MTTHTDVGRVGKPTGLSQAEPVSRLGPKGFDPSRVRELLDAVAPICAIVADYATHAGPAYEPHDRVLGRLARSGEVSPPYVNWGHLCAIEDAAYALAAGTEAAEPDAIAMEAGTETACGLDPKDDSAGRQASPKGARHDHS